MYGEVKSKQNALVEEFPHASETAHSFAISNATKDQRIPLVIQQNVLTNHNMANIDTIDTCGWMTKITFGL